MNNHQSLKKTYSKLDTKSNPSSHKFKKNISKTNTLRNQLHMMSIRRIIKKYKTNKVQTYLKKVVNHLIFNEKYKIVARFKDYLILDDCCEFLKR